MTTHDSTTGSRSPRWAFMSKLVIRRQPGEDYLTRWRIVQTPWFAVFLHKIETPDGDAHLHDHPWSFISVILKGGYGEDFKETRGTPEVYRGHGRWSVRRMDRYGWHQIVRLYKVPTWTLILTGPRRAEWGFLVDGKKIPWKEYIDAH